MISYDLLRRAADFSLSCLAFTTAVAVSASHASAQPVAATPAGTFQGVALDAMNAFLGIRYAAPPTGSLRWQPPQPVPAGLWSSDATAFGSHCPQLASYAGKASTTEDCLYLNVFSPSMLRQAGAALLPVMVWIHGGGLAYGESDDYDPAPLVTQGGVVVVTINYRLGYLGYFATSGLDAEGHLAGNYGLMDQQAALGWVARNIGGFGGDASRVAVFGQSGGGISTLSNVVSPRSRGLLSRAIVQSGAYALKLPTLAQEEASDGAAAVALGCAGEDTVCLRSLPVEQILAQQTNPLFGRTPIVDGAVLPLSIDIALQTGQFNRVPLMNGSNRDESRLFVAAQASLTADQYSSLLNATFGATLGTQVAAIYPVSDYAQPVLALAAVLTDETFACPARLADRYTSYYVPTYAYEFNDRDAPEDFLPPLGYPYGAAHASEIQFLFDIPKLAGTPALTAGESALSATMVQYWTGFAAGGSPDEFGEPAWLPYESVADDIQSLAPLATGLNLNFASVHHCSLWDPIIEPSPQ